MDGDKWLLLSMTLKRGKDTTDKQEDNNVKKYVVSFSLLPSDHEQSVYSVVSWQYYSPHHILKSVQPD